MFRAGILVIFLVLSCQSTMGISDQEFNALIAEAQDVDRLTNTSARKYVDVYFRLSEAFIERDRPEEALDAVKKGLRIDSTRYEYQYLAATLEFDLQEYQSAQRRLIRIEQGSTDEAILSQCRRLLVKLQGMNLDETIPLIPPMYEYTIYLASLGPADEMFLQAVSSKISEEFNITVEILPGQLTAQERNLRSTRQSYYDSVVETYINDHGVEMFNRLKNELLSRGYLDLKEDHNQQIVRFFYLQQDQGVEMWEQHFSHFENQYDAAELLSQLRTEYPERLNEENCLGILGVTSHDIYAEEYNFLFGWRSGNVAVMSYNRFTDSETALSIEIKRTVMQALSSAGHLVGIPRCTEAHCARAYPHSLAEHDLKEDQLCQECRINLLARYEELQ